MLLSDKGKYLLVPTQKWDRKIPLLKMKLVQTEAWIKIKKFTRRLTWFSKVQNKVIVEWSWGQPQKGFKKRVDFFPAWGTSWNKWSALLEKVGPNYAKSCCCKSQQRKVNNISTHIFQKVKSQRILLRITLALESLLLTSYWSLISLNSFSSH